MVKISRRAFLRKGSAAAMAAAAMGGGLGLGRAIAEPVGPRQASIERFGGFKMGIQSYSLRHFDLPQTIRHVADLNLHWVEFFPGHYNPTQDQDRIDEVAAMLRPADLNLSVHGVHGFGGNEARNRAVFEFAKRAGIPVLSAHPSPDSLPILDKLVKEYDIRVGIHNHGPRHRYDRVEDSLNAVAQWDERIGFCPDTGHYMRSGVDPVEALRRLGSRLYGIHLKDHAHIGRDEPAETILGEGAIDLEGVCQVLREVRFAGPLSLEYELNPENPLDDIRQGLANFAAAATA